MRRKILAGCRLMNPDLQHDPTAGCGPVPARERPKQGWVILAPADAADLPRAFEALEASGLRPIPWEPTPDASPQTDPGAAQVPVAELIAPQMWIVRPADALRFLGAASTDGQGSSGESTTPSLLHPAGAGRLRGQHLGGGAAPGHAPAIAPAETGQASARALRRA